MTTLLCHVAFALLASFVWCLAIGACLRVGRGWDDEIHYEEEQ